MAFTIQILSVRSSQSEGRALSINKTTTGYTVVGRLVQLDSESPVFSKTAKNLEAKYGGAKVTIKMNKVVYEALTNVASQLYGVETTPFYLLTFTVKAFSSPQWSDDYGFNISLDAKDFIEVAASPIEPDMLNDTYCNIYSQDAAERSAIAVENNRQLRTELQNALVAQAIEDAKPKRGRKEKAEV